MGKSAPSSQTVVNKTELPEWIQQAGQKNLAAAYEVSKNMLGPYTGPRVAGATPAEESIVSGITQNYAMTQPAFAYASELAKNVGSYQPTNVAAGTIANTDLSAYMNPYTSSVIASSLDALNQQRQIGLNEQYERALKAKAFGGSRQAIQEGVVNAATQQQVGKLVSELMEKNYNKAIETATSDIDRKLVEQKLNQAAGLEGAGLNLKSAATIGDLAAKGLESYLSGSTSALSAQELLRAIEQEKIDADKAAYTEAQQFPIQQLQIPIQALGATPYGQTNTQTGPGQTSSPLLTGLGATSSAVSILAGLASL